MEDIQLVHPRGGGGVCLLVGVRFCTELIYVILCAVLPTGCSSIQTCKSRSTLLCTIVSHDSCKLPGKTLHGFFFIWKDEIYKLSTNHTLRCYKSVFGFINVHTLTTTVSKTAANPIHLSIKFPCFNVHNRMLIHFNRKNMLAAEQVLNY